MISDLSSACMDPLKRNSLLVCSSFFSVIMSQH